MMPGTTPTLSIGVPFDTDVIQEIWITLSVGGTELFTFTKNRCHFNAESVKVRLTQEETLQVPDNSIVDIQLAVLRTDGIVMRSYVMREPAYRVLKKEVIR